MCFPPRQQHPGTHLPPEPERFACSRNVQATHATEDSGTCGSMVWASGAVGAQHRNLSPLEHRACARHLLNGGTNYQEPELSCRDERAAALTIGRLLLMQSPESLPCLVLW